MRIAGIVIGALVLAISATPSRAHDERLAPEVQRALDRWAEGFDRAVAERDVRPQDVQEAMKTLAGVETHALVHYCHPSAPSPTASPAGDKPRRVLRSVLMAREYAKATATPWELGFLLTSSDVNDRIEAIVRLAREEFTDDFLSCVIRLSKDDRPELRVGAARLLTMWTSFRGYDDRAVNAADALLVDREPGVALETAHTLVSWDDRRTIKRLLDRVTDARVPRKGLPPYVGSGNTSVGHGIRGMLVDHVSDTLLFGDMALRVRENESLEAWRGRVGPEIYLRNPKLWTLIIDEGVTIPPSGESVVVERDGVVATLRYENFSEGRDDGEPVLTKTMRVSLNIKAREKDPIVNLDLGTAIGTFWGWVDKSTYSSGQQSPEGDFITGQAFDATLMAVPNVQGGVRSKVRVWHRKR